MSNSSDDAWNETPRLNDAIFPTSSMQDLDRQWVIRLLPACLSFEIGLNVVDAAEGRLSILHMRWSMDDPPRSGSAVQARDYLRMNMDS